MIRTILADDHKLFSDGLKKLLDESEHFKVVKQFVRTDSLLEEFDQLECDLLILDIDIPGLNGLETLRRVRLKDESVIVVILSMHEESVYSKEALAGGANGYLTKSMDSALMISELLKVSKGEKIFPAAVSAWQPKMENQILSKQETKILRLVAVGKTSEEIAEELAISELTVKVHRRNMMKKLGSNNSAELISIGFSKGII
ncbi:MAG: response regulator transcription factor [Cyclobacteriaceae bacterium]